MFVLALLPIVVWLLLGSSHLAIHVIQVSSVAQPRANFALTEFYEVRRMHLPRTLVNKDNRKRLRYILSTQLLPKDLQRQELAGCILL